MIKASYPSGLPPVVHVLGGRRYDRGLESLTIRRAFQVLRGINFVIMRVNGVMTRIVNGITELREKIIRLVAGECLNYYRLESV